MTEREAAELAELKACLAVAVEYLGDASESGDAEGMHYAGGEIMALLEALEEYDA